MTGIIDFIRGLFSRKVHVTASLPSPPRQNEGLQALHRGEEVDFLVFTKVVALPDGAKVGRLDLGREYNLGKRWKSVPPGLDCRILTALESEIEALPPGVRVRDRLDLSRSPRLVSLPEGILARSISLRECPLLKSLPAGLDLHFLDASGCRSLGALPGDLKVSYGRLNLRDCGRIRSLPPSVGPLATLDIAGTAINQLPDSLVVTSAIDIGGTEVDSLPAGCQDARLFWRGVPIDDRIAFRPQEITGDEVLDEDNAERRRVLLDRMGFERFFEQVDAELLDQDADPGGIRRLLKVTMANDEDLVCVSVRCPSTEREYLLRVPPATTTCRAAVAWTAGFDDPDDYRPRIET